MSLLRCKRPWYVAGLAFECVGCGRCCAGPTEGYVWVAAPEVAAIARVLGMSVDETFRRFVRKVGRRHSIVEDPLTRDCVLLSANHPAADCRGRACRVYQARPAQCRAWPFWPANLTTPEAWAVAATRCPGMNRGTLFSYDEIQAMRSTSPF